MNAKNICNLPAAGAMSTGDGVLVMQGGKAVYMSLTDLLTYVASANVITDKTLTLADVAADAAAVGAALEKKEVAGLVAGGVSVSSDSKLDAALEAQYSILAATGGVRHFNLNFTSSTYAVIYPGLWVCTMYDVGNYTRLEMRHIELGINMVRLRSSGTWGEFEYDPSTVPMEAGMEYRTTERHGNEAVYTKLVSCGTLAGNGTAQRAVNVTYSDTAVTPIRAAAHASNALFGANTEITFDADDTKIRFVVPASTESYTGVYAQVWYTK